MKTLSDANNAKGTAIVIPPDLWDPELEGVISAWLFAEGDIVRAGDLIAEVMVEKSTFEITAPTGGQLRILVLPDIPFKPGTVIGQIQ